jgi:hypothetical protein
MAFLFQFEWVLVIPTLTLPQHTSDDLALLETWPWNISISC